MMKAPVEDMLTVVLTIMIALGLLVMILVPAFMAIFTTINGEPTENRRAQEQELPHG